MDVIRNRQEKRRMQIAEIGKAIAEAKAEGVEVDKKRLVLMTMSRLNLSRRTAAEYVELALFENE